MANYQDYLDPVAHEKNLHLGVHLTLHLRPLARGTARVEHDLGVLAGVYHETDNPFGMPEHSSAQQCLAKIDRVFVVSGDNSGSELIHAVIWLLAINTKGVLGICAFFGVAKMGQCWTSTSRLEICLSVQVFRLHESDVFFLGGCTDDDVCGDRFIVVNFNEISNFDVLPSSTSPTRVAFVMFPAKKAMLIVILSGGILGTVRGIIVFVSVVIGLLGVLLIIDRLGRCRTLLHFNIPRFQNLGFLPERAGDEPSNKRFALLPGDVLIDKISTLQYPDES